jgi:error-prone DNA polymerase
MLQKADSVGLFQVESRAQMNMLPRLKPANYYDLVVQVAIVRPGPIHGDMVHPYLKRKSGKEPPDLPLPELEPILGRTFGVPIFQEQVIAMAMVAAGFNADEAEELRRSMASWKQEGHMGRLRQKMTNNLLVKGVSNHYVERICRQIEGFGEYGFPESHAASFALIVYVSAWLKYYYPAEFCCGLLNSQPMGFYQPWQLIQDLQRHGIKVLPADINHSQWEHTIAHHAMKAIGSIDSMESVEPEASSHLRPGFLRLGFRSIKGLQECMVNRLCEQRPLEGFTCYEAIHSIVGMDRESLEKLASANVFAVFGDHRYQQRWRAAGHQYFAHLYTSQAHSDTRLKAPQRVEEIRESYESIRLILDDHPVAYLRDQGYLDDCLSADQLQGLPHKKEVFVAGLIVNRQRPKTSAGVTFITLEDETGSVNLVVWLHTAIKQMETLVKARFIKVYGRVDKDEGGDVIHVIAYRLFDISPLMDKLATSSRDFH